MSRHPLVRSDIYPDRWTAVYRLYDAAQRLLYVGIGYDYLARWKSHAKDKAWWPEVASRDVTWYDNRLDAAYEEARVICDEAPLHNEEEGISPFGFATFRIGDCLVPSEMDFSRRLLDPARFNELFTRRKHTVLAVRGRAVAVMVPIDWYREAADKLGDPTEF